VFLDSFSAVPRALSPFFMFCALRLVFGSTEGVKSNFHVLCSRTCFGQFRRRRVRFSCFALSDSFWCYRGRRAHFSCFTLPDSFSTVPRGLGPGFMFFSPRLILGGTKGIIFSFHVFRSHTRFQRYRWRRVHFSCVTLLDSFWTVPRASCPLFMFCAFRLIFGGTKCAESSFHVLRS
jgi:hypothetical protein